jgi:hypothetical protein
LSRFFSKEDVMARRCKYGKRKNSKRCRKTAKK